MPTRNINLTDHYHELVEELVASGQYQNASEVIRAGLHLLEKRAREDEEKVKLLRSLAQEGFSQLDQGKGLVLNGEDELREAVTRIGKRAASSSRT